MQVKFNKPFKDLKLNRKVDAGEVIDITKSRADQIVKTIKEKSAKEKEFSAYKDFSYEEIKEAKE